MCDKTFANTENLTTHVNSIHGGTIYNCGKCDKAYNLKSNLSRHIKASHEGKKYVCKLCDKTFSDQSYLKNHDRSYHKGYRHKYQCEKCGKYLTSNANLRKHIVALHDEFKDLPNQVSITSQKSKVHVDQKPKTKQCKDLPKPKKGMWIVKLKRLKSSDISNF